MTPDEEIAVLRAENAQQREQIAGLVARVQELEARLAKDSHNSGKPPSSDGLVRKTRSLRKRSGKQPGGQLGHPGETRHLVATPDELIEHRPAVCPACQTPRGAIAPVAGYERRQVRDLPPVRLVIREHRALHVRCPACQAVAVGAFPGPQSGAVWSPAPRAGGLSGRAAVDPPRPPAPAPPPARAPPPPPRP